MVQKCKSLYGLSKSTTWRIGKLYSSTCKQISWQNISWGLMFYAILDSLMALSTVQMLRSNPQKRLSGTKLVKPWRPYNDTRRYIYVLVLRWYFSTLVKLKIKVGSFPSIKLKIKSKTKVFSTPLKILVSPKQAVK